MSDMPLETDPGLLFKWSQDIGKTVVGEEKNRIIVLLVCVTSRNSRPMFLLIMGESSAGKSHIVNSIIKYFEGEHINPRTLENYGERVIKVQRITSAALNRLQKNLNGKILVVEELAGAEAAQPQLRVMMSEGNLRLLTSVYDERGKIMEKSKEIVTEGTPVFITTSTATTLETETNTRLFVTSMDETEEQTRRIIEHQAKQHQTLNIPQTNELNPQFKDVIGKLYPVEKVLIPYSNLLAKVFPSTILKARRDFPKLLNMIEVMTFLHQHQRPRIETPYGDYLVALPIDFFLSWRIIDDAIRETVSMISKRLQRIMSVFDKDQHYMVQQVASLVGLSATRTHELLKELSNQSFLLRDDQSRPYVYYRNPDKEATIVSINEIVAELNSFTEDYSKIFVDQVLRDSIRICDKTQNLNIDNTICVLTTLIHGVAQAPNDSVANIIRILELAGFHIHHWVYEARYVDPLTGEGYYVGTPEFLEHYCVGCSENVSKLKIAPIKVDEPKRGSIENCTVRPLDQLRAILEENDGEVKQIQDIITRLKQNGVDNPDGVINQMVRDGTAFRPNDYTIKATYVTLTGLKEPGH